VSGAPWSERARRAANSPIGELMARALSQPELISLAAGFVDRATLPAEAAASAAAAVLRDSERARTALQYGATAGHPELRARVLARVLAQDAGDRAGPGRGFVPSENQVVLSAGSNQLLYLLASALLDPGDCVLCDSPTYFVFADVVRAVGGRCIGIASDGGGMRLDALEAELDRHAARGELGRIKAIYVTSYFDNPRGVSLARERRAGMIELVRRYTARQHQHLYVLEDAAYRELGFDAPDVASLRAHDASGEHVVYLGTFSKSFSPGVRVGFGILPRALVLPILDLKGVLDFGSGHFDQHVIDQVLQSGAYEPHVALLRSTYAHKAKSMQMALDEHVVRRGLGEYLRPDGGLYVWLSAAPHVDTGADGALFASALAGGVLYVPGAYCFAGADNPPRNCMRLSFGVQTEPEIARGIEKLASALAAVT
jgi:2-aminoadipate transaminase